MFVPHRKHTYKPPRPVTETTLVFYGDVRTSRETHLCASMACYGNTFTFLYRDNVRTSQKTHLWASTACYGTAWWFSYLTGITPIGLHGLLRRQLYFVISRWCSYFAGSTLWGRLACYRDRFLLFLPFYQQNVCICNWNRALESLLTIFFVTFFAVVLQALCNWRKKEREREREG
jgi:hypothetical protein